ncbi:hypothetical protein [Paucibacter sp. DJ2R-2]|uniref:hypothetical protein n=1 Tax=Paucibacter sp. DJ2R-2 TaxID=2893558 RepID=UPI0021E3DC14|nr:hypothetical protein [Paucibacter sp. DJ2R-2]MCV2421123.1 hypothetical protein [Paucibacter sp. DJ4R-1]MCV2439101.1 hypothetical protein [Paucibacter sp. DJ2R-2]
MTPLFNRASLAALFATLLCACGGGGSTQSLELTPSREEKLITQGQMLASLAVALVADDYSQTLILQLFRNQVMDLYQTQTVSGSYPCKVSGRLELIREGPIWRYSAHDCHNINIQLASGSWTLDTSQAASMGLQLQIKQLVFRKFYSDIPDIMADGSFSIDKPNAGGLEQQGRLSLSYGGETRVYEQIALSGPASSAGSQEERRLQVARSPGTPLPLTMQLRKGRLMTVSAADGSNVSTDIGSTGDYVLELRHSAQGPVVLSRQINRKDLQLAIAKARL